ncbi:MAG: diguanylate cyclase [Candidatus Sedimenticola sp. (ex Thyasira tokunagai)]
MTITDINTKLLGRTGGVFLMTTLAVWSIVLGFSAYWNVSLIQEQTSLAMQQDAESRYLAIETLRKWIGSHGGVYVPTSERVQPHPGLAHIPEQNVTTPSGKKLTLMNGFVVAAAVAKQFGISEGNRFRMTSMDPKSSENAPDPWEIKALQRLDETGKQFSEITSMGDEVSYRVLVPVKIAAKCYRCHLFTGRTLGDVAGGIGINLRISPYMEAEHQETTRLLYTYGVIWLLGVIGIGISGRSWQRQQHAMALYQQELQRLATHDPLTGLLNRSEMRRQLGIELGRADRYNRSPSIMMVDLDHFKRVNDVHGHQAGDRVLEDVSRLIREQVRDVDIVARYGGEEILVILPETNKESARVLAERLREDIEKQVITLTNGVEIQITASIGVAGYEDDGSTLEALISRADQALYVAKSSGRNRVNCLSSDEEPGAGGH